MENLCKKMTVYESSAQQYGNLDGLLCNSTLKCSAQLAGERCLVTFRIHVTFHRAQTDHQGLCSHLIGRCVSLLSPVFLSVLLFSLNMAKVMSFRCSA